MLLLKNADLYAPEHVGRSDVLVGGGKILAVSKGLDFRVKGLEVYDLQGKILAPGSLISTYASRAAARPDIIRARPK